MDKPTIAGHNVFVCDNEDTSLEITKREVKIEGRYEDRSDVGFPYRSVIEFYQRELGYLKSSEAEEAARAEKRKLDLTPEQRSARRRQMEKLNAARKAVGDSGKLDHWTIDFIDVFSVEFGEWLPTP